MISLMVISLTVNVIFLVLVLKYVLDLVLVVWCNFWYGVPYVPTNMKVIRQLVKEVELKEGSKVVELGSGDGRVLVELAKKFKIKALGVEKNSLLRLMAKLRAKLTPFKKGEVKFIDGDLFTFDLKGYDVVYLYLLPWMIERLRGDLEKKLKKGALVISFDYPLKSDKFVMEKLIGTGKQKIAVYKHL